MFKNNTVVLQISWMFIFYLNGEPLIYLFLFFLLQCFSSVCCNANIFLFLFFYLFHPNVLVCILWLLLCSCPGLSCVMFSVGHVTAHVEPCLTTALKVNSLQTGDPQPFWDKDWGHANATSTHCHFAHALSFNAFLSCAKSHF